MGNTDQGSSRQQACGGQPRLILWNRSALQDLWACGGWGSLKDPWNVFRIFLPLSWIASGSLLSRVISLVNGHLTTPLVFSLKHAFSHFKWLYLYLYLYIHTQTGFHGKQEQIKQVQEKCKQKRQVSANLWWNWNTNYPKATISIITTKIPETWWELPTELRQCTFYECNSHSSMGKTLTTQGQSLSAYKCITLFNGLDKCYCFNSWPYKKICNDLLLNLGIFYNLGS